MKKWGKHWFGLGCLIILFGLSGCSGTSHPNVTLPSSLFSKHLLVMPFYAVRSGGTIVTCPVCGRNNPAGPVSTDAEAVLTDMLVVGLERRGFDVIPVSRVEEALLHMGEKKASKNLLATAQQLAKRFKAKLVVCGVVFEYRAREGSSIGVSKPAAVSFSLHLIDGKTGHILWVDRYSETQEALSEDVSNIGKFLKRKGQWVTARRLAYDGMNSLLDHFPEPE